ncbi:RNA 2',3'-cyclic phosphodiesterase [Microbulbifer aggregans]|uniref:RNA 2',3'-cyclic phosphodiesterase n=1 Tax=Microbulbifer aggregans TaxID=1769779 RepID=UPI001CFE03D7|nr:RNA 2',3'-cyclic phosphodiesterase [Microbulbifer aggregans]
MTENGTNATPRLFIGVDPDAATQRFLDATATECRHQALPRDTRWISHSNRHLTLAFLGETPADRIERIETRLLEISLKTREIWAQAVSTHPFPKTRSKLLATELLPSPELDQLHQRCRQLMIDIGIRPESTRYRPHFTLARSRQGFARVPPLPTHNLCLLNNLTLYHSLLAPGGSQYSQLARFPFSSS